MHDATRYRAVDELFRDAARLGREDLRRLASEEADRDPSACERAWDTAVRVAHEVGLKDELRWIDEHVETWARQTASGSVPAGIFGVLGAEAGESEVRVRAARAIADAATATLLADRLETADFEVLHGPWAAHRAQGSPR